MNIAEKIKPEQNVEKLPKGEILKSSLMFIELVFLNFGGFLFVKSIGTNAIENNKEIKQIFSNDLIENLVRTKRQELNEFKKIESSKHWKYYVSAI